MPRVIWPSGPLWQTQDIAQIIVHSRPHALAQPSVSRHGCHASRETAPAEIEITLKHRIGIADHPRINRLEYPKLIFADGNASRIPFLPAMILSRDGPGGASTARPDTVQTCAY